MGWWETKKHILVREKRKIDEAFPNNNFSFRVIDNSLWISGTLLDFFEFECRYPHSYPSAPPDIFPKNRYTKWVPGHQYMPEGRFCLDIREKTWSSILTAADIINSLRTLLIAEGVKRIEKLDELPVYEEREPNILDKIIENKFGVFPSDITLPSEKSNGTFEYILLNKSNQIQFIVTAIKINDQKLQSEITKTIWVEHNFQGRRKGFLAKISSDSSIKILLSKNLEDFYKALRDGTELSEDADIEKFVKFIFIVEGPAPLLFTVSVYKEKSKVLIYGLYYFDIERLMDRFPDQTDHDLLKSKKVTIVDADLAVQKTLNI